MLNKFFLNPSPNMDINNYNDILRNIRYDNLNNIYNNTIELYKNNTEKLTTDYKYTRKFIFSFDNSIINVNNLKEYNDKINFIENLNFESNHYINCTNFNDIVKYNIIIYQKEINKLIKETDNNNSFLLNNIKNEISKKEEEIIKLEKKYLNYIDDIENFDEIKDLDENNFWDFKFFKVRQNIFKKFRFVILKDNFNSNISLFDKIIEVYLSGAIPLISNENKYINNNILNNILIPSKLDELFLEKLFTTYTFEYLIGTSYINNKSINEIVNYGNNLESFFYNNNLISQIPEYLNIDYFDKLGDTIKEYLT
jgi:hypothetical protein